MQCNQYHAKPNWLIKGTRWSSVVKLGCPRPNSHSTEKKRFVDYPSNSERISICIRCYEHCNFQVWISNDPTIFRNFVWICNVPTKAFHINVPVFCSKLQGNRILYGTRNYDLWRYTVYYGSICTHVYIGMRTCSKLSNCLFDEGGRSPVTLKV